MTDLSSHSLNKRTLLAWLVLAVCPQSFVAAFETSELQLNFEGRHRFRLGDDLKWAETHYDDSAWSEISVPGGWMAQGQASYPRRGWYRIHFVWTGNEPNNDELALVFGAVRSAFEVYLNGVLIEASGGVDKGNVWSQLPRARIADIPRESLRLGENVLAIRVLRLVVDGGIRRGPFGIGEAVSLHQAEQNWLRPILLWETAFLVFYFASVLFSSMLYFLGYRAQKHLLFIIMLVHVSLSHLTNGELLDFLNLESAMTRQLALGVDQLFPITTLLFLKTVLMVRFGSREKSLLGAYLLLCIGWWWNEWTIDNLYFPWVLYSVTVFGCLSLFWCIRAYWNKQPDANALLVGVVGFIAIYWAMLISSIRSALLGSTSFHETFYVPSDWFAWLWIHLCMMFMLAAGYVRQRHELTRATNRILEVQENERSRIARDLHDGVGQSILAMKMELEVMEANHLNSGTSSALSNLIKSTDDLLDDVRIVSADLRPSVLDRSGLVVAIEALAESIRRSTEICITVNVVGECELRKSTEAQLYRIAQEAIANAIRHGKAEVIEVFVEFKASLVVLSIKDDGIGINTEELRAGQGLANMKDRAQTMGGQMKIESSPRKKTIVQIEVPNAC